MTQALYGTADLLIIGIFTDTAGISAVANATQVMQIVNGLIAGLTMGGTIVVGQYYGANKKDDTERTIGTILTAGFVFALIITVGMLFSANWLLRIIQTPAEAFYDASAYVRIASSGVVFITGYNAISAILRGLGDAKSPVYFIGIASVINIVLDLLFVGLFEMRAAGAALATIIAQAVSVILAIIYLSRKEFIFKFKLANFRIDKAKLKQLIRVGTPLSLQEILLWSSFLIIAAIANSMGVANSAAVGIIGKFDVFAMLPPIAISYALAAMAAQNIGANKPERALQALKAGISISIFISLFFVLWAQIHPQSIMGIFKADQDVVEAGAQYLRSFSIDFLLVAIKFNLNGFLNGCGRTTFSMINGIVASVFVRIPLAFLLAISLSWGLMGLGLAAPIASLLSIAVSIIFIRKGSWRRSIVETK